MVITLLTTICEYLQAADIGFDQKEFAAAVTELFDADVEGEFSDLATLIIYLTDVRKKIDFAVGNSLLKRELPNVSILFSPGRLVFGIPDILRTRIQPLSDVLIVY